MTENVAPILEMKEMNKTYQMGEVEVHALRGVSLAIRKGEYVAVIGASGSGKSTLMNMIGLLDRPTTGSYKIRGTETSQLSKNEQADMRNSEIGFVFQRFNLLARTIAQRQVELPLFYAGVTGSKAKQMAREALTKVGLGNRLDHRPDQLSGGQQQRVAIARALVNTPTILLADEPTGALDTKTASEILNLFDELYMQGLTIIVVTHDMKVANHARRVITLSDGVVVSDVQNGQSQENIETENQPMQAVGGATQNQQIEPLASNSDEKLQYAQTDEPALEVML